jgi:hypothetical protein
MYVWMHIPCYYGYHDTITDFVHIRYLRVYSPEISARQTATAGFLMQLPQTKVFLKNSSNSSDYVRNNTIDATTVRVSNK